MRADLSRYTVLSLIPELKNVEAPKQVAPREETRAVEPASAQEGNAKSTQSSEAETAVSGKNRV